ncbi:hypothetical protein STA3757_28130 [Stanieria sp. NIES-3757]|nr:hypothetical protein STA3757_28130 [Stanieria sp. NIES-3757]
MFKPKPIPPQPDQESVWDYPRPPRLESSTQHIQVIFNQITIADSHRTYRVLETSHPPVYYIPPEDIQMEYLHQTPRQSFCEWKGTANYYTIQAGDRQEVNAAWFYSDPTHEFAALKNYVAFYPSRMDACYIDEEKVQPQPGDFYGGWITKNIVGPFKGSVDSWGW